MTIAIKPYPVCHFNHAFIDAALELKQQYGLQPEDVAEITALIHPGQSAGGLRAARRQAPARQRL